MKQSLFIPLLALAALTGQAKTYKTIQTPEVMANANLYSAEVAKRDDVKLVFIAGERIPGGSDAYKKYVAEWLAEEEAVCLSDDDFRRLQELFRFNGIPHYETITPDGCRVRDDISISGLHNFDYEIRQLKNRLK